MTDYIELAGWRVQLANRLTAKEAEAIALAAAGAIENALTDQLADHARHMLAAKVCHLSDGCSRDSSGLDVVARRQAVDGQGNAQLTP